MQISVTQADGNSNVRIEGELRIGSVADAKPELVAMLAAGGEVRLDLRELGECDTAGIQLLLMTFASARAKGRRCITIGHTAAFRAALDRVGIAADCFDFQSPAPDDGHGDPGRG